MRCFGGAAPGYQVGRFAAARTATERVRDAWGARGACAWRREGVLRGCVQRARPRAGRSAAAAAAGEPRRAPRRTVPAAPMAAGPTVVGCPRRRLAAGWPGWGLAHCVLLPWVKSRARLPRLAGLPAAADRRWRMRAALRCHQHRAPRASLPLLPGSPRPRRERSACRGAAWCRFVGPGAIC